MSYRYRASIEIDSAFFRRSRYAGCKRPKDVCMPLVRSQGRRVDGWLLMDQTIRSLRRRIVGPGSRPGRQRLSALLRGDLPWGRWRVDEVGGELRVARFRIHDRLLLDRAVAADAIGQ